MQEALFAYVDTLTKTLLTGVPEPPAEAKAQAVARAKERYDRLLKQPSLALHFLSLAVHAIPGLHGTPGNRVAMAYQDEPDLLAPGQCR
jgi:hypothetical protein